MSETDGSGLGGVCDALRAVQRVIEDYGRDSDIGEMIGGGKMGGIDDVFVELTDENYEKLAGLARDAERRMEDADLVTGDPSESIHVSRLHAAYNELRRIRLRSARVGDDLVLIQGTVLTLSEVLQHGINAVGQVLRERTATPASGSWEVLPDALLQKAAGTDGQTGGSSLEATRAKQAESDADASICRHGETFRSVIWYGSKHNFTGAQAGAIRKLWKAWEDGTPDVPTKTLLDVAGVGEKSRLLDVFRNSSAWKTMIVSGATSGTYRLKKPE